MRRDAVSILLRLRQGDFRGKYGSVRGECYSSNEEATEPSAFVSARPADIGSCGPWTAWGWPWHCRPAGHFARTGGVVLVLAARLTRLDLFILIIALSSRPPIIVSVIPLCVPARGQTRWTRDHHTVF